MKIVLIKLLMLSALLIAAQTMAQVVQDVGFKSVGRGWPLAVSVQNRPIVGPAWTGGAFARGPSPDQKLDGSRVPPQGIKPLPVDIFTSKDFYKDKALWTDKRYYRCNSPQASEVQRGILTPNPLNTGKDEDAPWGHCDRDLLARCHRAAPGHRAPDDVRHDRRRRRSPCGPARWARASRSDRARSRR